MVLVKNSISENEYEKGTIYISFARDAFAAYFLRKEK